MEVNPAYPVREITQAAYDALTYPDPDVLYCITDSPEYASTADPPMRAQLMTLDKFDHVKHYQDDVLYCIVQNIAAVLLSSDDVPTTQISYFDDTPEVVAFLKSNPDSRYFVRIFEGGAPEIASYSLVDCTSLVSIDLPGSFSEIKDGVFGRCRSLKNVVLRDGITQIGDYAFSECSALTQITIPGSVQRIGSSSTGSSFASCTSLTQVVLMPGVAEIGNHTFSDCAMLPSINLPDSLTAIGMGAFSRCTSLTDIQIPGGVTSIGAFAFARCENLTAITISKPQGSISGAPWGATNATVTWTG